jgi:hypothetical protein
MQGHCTPEFRLPLVPLNAVQSATLRDLLETHNLL